MKKLVATTFMNRNPTALDNLAAGYSLGQRWFNIITGDEFRHKLNGVWIMSDVQFQLSSSIIADKKLGVDSFTGQLTTDLSKIETVYTIKLPNAASVGARCSGASVGIDYPANWSINPWASNPNNLEITHNLMRDIAVITIYQVLSGVSQRLLINNQAFAGIVVQDNTNLRIENLATVPSPIIIHLVFAK